MGVKKRDYRRNSNFYIWWISKAHNYSWMSGRTYTPRETRLKKKCEGIWGRILPWYSTRYIGANNTWTLLCRTWGISILKRVVPLRRWRRGERGWLSKEKIINCRNREERGMCVKGRGKGKGRGTWEWCNKGKKETHGWESGMQWTGERGVGWGKGRSNSILRSAERRRLWMTSNKQSGRKGKKGPGVGGEWG